MIPILIFSPPLENGADSLSLFYHSPAKGTRGKIKAPRRPRHFFFRTLPHMGNQLVKPLGIHIVLGHHSNPLTDESIKAQ